MINTQRLALVVQREYLALVAKKAFLVMTIVLPAFVILAFFIPGMLEQLNQGDVGRVAVIDETGRYGNALQSTAEVRFELVSQAATGLPRDYYRRHSDDLYAMVIIPRDIETRHQVLVYSDGNVSASVLTPLSAALEQALSQSRMRALGVPDLDRLVEQCRVSLDVRTITLGDDGMEADSNTAVAVLAGLLLAMLIYFFVVMYGTMIMNSVIEEKTNRIMEVIVSTCRPMELMLGKIIGVALVGLTQMAVWLVIIGVAVGIIAAQGGLPDPATLPADSGTYGEMMALVGQAASLRLSYLALMFVLYFLGGFLLYAAIFAALGSAVDQPSDASQFTMPVIAVILVALYATIACIDNPDGAVAFWCSLVPFTSPMVMMTRLGYDLPLWQTALSLALLYATALITIALAGRIFRTGILLFGRKNTFADLARWLLRR